MHAPSQATDPLLTENSVYHLKSFQVARSAELEKSSNLPRLSTSKQVYKQTNYITLGFLSNRSLDFDIE